MHASLREVIVVHLRSLFLASALCLLAGEGLARAADAGEAEDIKTLEKQLNDETTALSTSDCAAACRALRSIRRAADRICALEPGGARCDAARAKADDATRRVHDACPDCSLAAGGMTPAPEPRREEAMTKGGSTANGPPPASESGRGGCRSCHSAASARGSNEIDVGLLALGILGVLRVTRRRSQARKNSL